MFDDLGRRPRLGDAVALGDVTLRIAKLDALRISRLRITSPERGAPDAPAG